MGWWEQIWYEHRFHPLSLLLVPAAWLFCLLTWLRRRAYSNGLLLTNKLPVPVIIVGNISVGGTGKTPLVIWLADFLKKQGYKPGIISRGYGGQIDQCPQQVKTDSDPLVVGDEAVVIARRTACPVYVGSDRFAAGTLLLKNYDCDIVVSDDGLQHYALHRDFEICVIDGTRRHGNGRCLPAGPLRELASRLKLVDAVVCNGAEITGEFHMHLEPRQVQQIAGNGSKSLEAFKAGRVHAIAGTGNPNRFFTTLRQQGLTVDEHAFDDHHRFKSTDIQFNDQQQVIMTEKDAVKCHNFANENHWFLSVEAKLPVIFEQRLLNRLKKIAHG